MHARRAAPRASPSAGSRYLAAIDPATRGNAWTLTVARRQAHDLGCRGRRRWPWPGREWIGSRSHPLDPGKVLEEIKGIIEPYGLRGVNTDAWAIDALKSIASRVGLTLREHEFSAEAKVEVYRSLDSLLRQHRIELPPHDALKRDLRSVRKKASAKGITVDLPITSDGRHCDFAPSTTLATWLLARRTGAGGMIRAMQAVMDRGGPAALVERMQGR